MNDDGFDGIVIGKLLQLGDDLFGGKNHAIEIDDGNLGTEAGKRFFRIPAAKTHVDQREHTDGEQHKQPAADQNPHPNPRTLFRHNQMSVAPVNEVRGKRSDCRG